MPEARNDDVCSPMTRCRAASDGAPECSETPRTHVPPEAVLSSLHTARPGPSDGTIASSGARGARATSCGRAVAELAAVDADVVTVPALDVVDVRVGGVVGDDRGCVESGDHGAVGEVHAARAEHVEVVEHVVGRVGVRVRGAACEHDIAEIAGHRRDDGVRCAGRVESGDLVVAAFAADAGVHVEAFEEVVCAQAGRVQRIVGRRVRRREELRRDVAVAGGMPRTSMP